ncbi:type 2 periplasmic-binding domain-containing protein [Parafrankia elaeagni]|uniref:hypothetical protein n=1 Tax=Parafrankia elaeagni TaxID=222534 RepID=UPI00035ED8D7|nr:hypothetical protein [Parafrankia elaeagni]
MTAPGKIVKAPRTEESSIRWEPNLLAEDLFGDGLTVPIATLGPRGTSAMAALDWFAEHVQAVHRTVIQPRAYPNFDELLEAVTNGGPRFALVPSAAESATRFFWSPRLRLLGSFSRPTPRYGLAVRRGSSLPTGSALRVSSLPETEGLIELLEPRFAPDTADSSPGGWTVEWVTASSTYHAAQLARQGAADVAVTNEPARAACGLTFLSSRSGIAMIWLLFGQRSA